MEKRPEAAEADREGHTCKDVYNVREYLTRKTRRSFENFI